MLGLMRELNINLRMNRPTVSVLAHLIHLCIPAMLALSISLAVGAPPPELKEQKPEPDLLKDPKSPGMNKQAPAKYQVKFVTSKGDFIIEVQREWAPKGADRFYNLARNGWFDEVRFFRVIKGFMAQFGISGD